MSSITDLCKRINEDLATSVATKTFWTTKIMVNGDKCVYRDYPEIEVEYEDLIKMFDEDSYSKVIGELRKPVVEPPVVEAPVQQEPPVDSQELYKTRDMLANTGLTVTMDPINSETSTQEEVSTQKEDSTVEAPITPEAPSVQSTGMKMTKKPMNFKRPKANSQSGFAEVIALGVIVLVYIAIIVNLIIRLK